MDIRKLEDILIYARVKYDNVLSVVKNKLRDKTDFDFFIGYKFNQYMVCTDGLNRVPISTIIKYINDNSFITYEEFKKLCHNA